MLLPDGKNEYRTCGGSLLSICTALIVLGFAAIKILAVVTRSEHRLQHQAEENFFKDVDTFSEKDGLFIAAGITAYDGGESDGTVPANIGAIKFYRKAWSDNAGISFTEIETRKCTYDDFDYGPLRN